MSLLKKILNKPDKPTGNVYYNRGPQKPSAPASLQDKRFIMDIAGLYYHIKELHKAGTVNRMYYLKDEDLIATGKKKVFRFRFDKPMTLEEEPTNKHDPNAIKILIDGCHVGYVPAEFCVMVKKAIANNAITDIQYNIKGGEYKYIENNTVYEDENDYTSSVIISYKG